MNRPVIVKSNLVLILLAVTALHVSAATPWSSGPLRVSPDGYHFQQADGQPFFWLGDTAWLITQKLNREEVATYFKNRRAKGFNVVQFCVVQFLNDKSIYGSPALVGDDLTRLNVTPGALTGDMLRVSWFNPRTGETTAAGTMAKARSATFDPPGEPAPGNDWVLILDDAARKYPTPATR